MIILDKKKEKLIIDAYLESSNNDKEFMLRAINLHAYYIIYAASPLLEDLEWIQRAIEVNNHCKYYLSYLDKLDQKIRNTWIFILILLLIFCVIITLFFVF